MKTLRHRLAALFALTALAGCSSAAGGALPRAAGPAPAAERAAAAAGSGGLVWTQTDGFKVRPTDKPIAANRSAAIEGAKGETVAFQIVVTAGHALRNVNVAFSDFSDGAGHTIPAASDVQLYREFYLDLTQPSGSYGHTGEYPDGLVPIGKDPYFHETRNGAPFAVAAGKNQAVWVDVAIPASAFAATYHAAATLTEGNAKLGTVAVTLTVWNFGLPATASLTTAFGLNTWDMYLGHYGDVWNTQKIEELTNLYQAEAIKHRISLYSNDVAPPSYEYVNGRVEDVSYALFDATYAPALAGTLPDAPGMKSTIAEIPDGNVALPGATPGPNDRQYVAYWKNVSAHFKAEGWSSRAFLYDIDEPQQPSDFQTAVHRADVLHAADPTLPAMVTTTIHKELVGHVNIWNPNVTEFDQPGFPAPSEYLARQKAGDTVWFYHSNSSLSSNGPWPNFFVDVGTTDTRIFSWMAWKYHFQGFLYYSVVLNYTRTSDPWTNVYNFGDNGDGVLFYPGKPADIGGTHDIPCDSIRLKLVRAAMQDYEYMEILHEKGQDAFVDSVVDKLVIRTNDWTQDPNALEKAREALAARIVGH